MNQTPTNCASPQSPSDESHQPAYLGMSLEYPLVPEAVVRFAKGVMHLAQQNQVHSFSAVVKADRAASGQVVPLGQCAIFSIRYQDRDSRNVPIFPNLTISLDQVVTQREHDFNFQ